MTDSPKFHLRYKDHDLTLTYSDKALYGRDMEQQERMENVVGWIEGAAFTVVASKELDIKGAKVVALFAEEGLIFSREDKQPDHVYLTRKQVEEHVKHIGLTHKDGSPAILPDVSDLFDDLKQEFAAKKNVKKKQHKVFTISTVG